MKKLVLLICIFVLLIAATGRGLRGQAGAGYVYDHGLYDLLRVRHVAQRSHVVSCAGAE